MAIWGEPLVARRLSWWGVFWLAAGCACLLADLHWPRSLACAGGVLCCLLAARCAMGGGR